MSEWSAKKRPSQKSTAPPFPGCRMSHCPFGALATGATRPSDLAWRAHHACGTSKGLCSSPTLAHVTWRGHLRTRVRSPLIPPRLDTIERKVFFKSHERYFQNLKLVSQPAQDHFFPFPHDFLQTHTLNTSWKGGWWLEGQITKWTGKFLLPRLPSGRHPDLRQNLEAPVMADKDCQKTKQGKSHRNSLCVKFVKVFSRIFGVIFSLYSPFIYLYMSR